MDLIKQTYQQALDCEANNDFHGALRHYEQCHHLAPENETYIRKADNVKQKIEQNLQRNLEIQLEKVAQNPKDTMAWRLLGFNYMAMELPDDALRCYRIPTDIEPDDPEHHYFLGMALQSVNNYTEAISTFEKFLQLDDEEDATVTANALHEIGACYLALKKHDEAADYFNKERKINPASPLSIVGLADTYKSQGEWLKAADHYIKAISFGWEGATHQLELHTGECFFRLGEKEEAKIWLELAVKKDATNNEALYNIGVLMLEQKDYEGAEMVLRMAHQADRLHVPTLNNLGFTLMKLGQTKEAITMTERSLELNPEYPQSLFLLAELYASISDYDKAYKLYFRYAEVMQGKN